MPPKSAQRRRASPDEAGSGFGDRLRRARSDRDLTLRQVSEASGVSIPYLSDLERGVLVNPTLDTLKKIAVALDVSLNQLLGVDDLGASPSYPKALEDFAQSEHFLQAVAEQARRHRVDREELLQEWLRALGGLRVRGRTPRESSDYLFIFEAVRRAFERA
jgi:transcriptional regulator with XRE-family HTH domain